MFLSFPLCKVWLPVDSCQVKGQKPALGPRAARRVSEFRHAGGRVVRPSGKVSLMVPYAPGA